MKQEITLTGFSVAESGQCEINYLWNDYANGAIYTDEAAMLANHADLLHEPDDAVSWLMYYLIGLGGNAQTLPAMVGKKLTIDITPAVQQNISFG